MAFGATRILLFSRCYQNGPKSLTARWYYNLDSPISKPEWYEYESEKSLEKFIPFSDHDNTRLEKAYSAKNSAVNVKEDRLYKVNIDRMEMCSIYWPGPVYEVRRGIWFTRNGLPIDGDQAIKIEQGYNVVKPYDFGNNAALIKSIPRDLVAKFNKELLKKEQKEPVDIKNEKDVVDLGNGKAAIFFDEVYGAIFPSSLSSFQVNIIRSTQPSYMLLMSVIPIQRGYSKNLDSSMVESVKSAKVSSLTQIIQNEVATLFSKSPGDRSLSEEPSDEEKNTILKSVTEADDNDSLLELASCRKINHLVFCVHGIGQLLGGKYESVNFTHSIKVMRSKMREVFANEKKYQKLAYGIEYDKDSEAQRANSTIQVLPIAWRHQVDFHPRKPFAAKEKKLPTLEQLNIDGVRPIRNVMGDVVLDILLFYEPQYLKQILTAVLSELNRVYQLYRKENPNFNGKVHLFGHSLGSAICFDLLCQQKNNKTSDYNLDFNVENFFSVGLPVGMFKLLQQKSLAPRSDRKEEDITPDLDSDSPKCKNLYNVFHPCDPVGYRLEPLVDLKFANIKPEEVPYALQGFNTQVQNLSSIGDDIQQKFWTASNWFVKEDESKSKATKENVKTPVDEENALGDIIYSLTSRKVQRSSSKNYKTKVFEKKDLETLLKINRTGRIDYSLPMGVFSIAIVSALSAHVSYFEDKETAGFVMKEILSCDQPSVKSRKVVAF